MSARLARLLRASQWQLGSLAAVALGFVIVFGAQALDGGTVRSLQLRAALIVFGGTLAATLISYSPRHHGRDVFDRAPARKTRSIR
jgi:hypothetical protein